MNIKPGDSVVVISNGWGGSKYNIKEVERVTKTRAIVGGQKFRLSDGRKVGDSGWFSSRIDEVNDHYLALIDEQREEEEHKRLFRFVQENASKLRVEQLRLVVDMINEE